MNFLLDNQLKIKHQKSSIKNSKSVHHSSFIIHH